MYLIEILHQTTTLGLGFLLLACCILSKFYIKPQQCCWFYCNGNGCILSKFYIKPQLESVTVYEVIVVSYRNSTSNHNSCLEDIIYEAVVSYRNSTSNHNGRPILLSWSSVVSYRNSTSNHNANRMHTAIEWVVSYRNSTSNHNCPQRPLG